MDLQKALIAEYDRETATTRKILEPFQRMWISTTNAPQIDEPGAVAGHLQRRRPMGYEHFSKGQDRDGCGEKFEPYVPASKAALLEKFDTDTAEATALLAKFAPAQWDDNWKFVAGTRLDRR